ncbi:hypothetical protein D0Y65_048184 [Glycine soja]|uniref:ATP-dependent DNA helicase n=1 Tax=Glycine soja TaxID=3848 RepID=A0A445FRX4_GLYSO|nr:hypothetical protein D0Y65_048184 [Glycine soja]
MFQPHTVLDADGYPIYHRRNNGHTIEKNGVIIDNRYICPCESTWRIFGFPIHGRKPTVERLHFHLPSQHSIVYEDHDDIDDVLSKPSISNLRIVALQLDDMTLQNLVLLEIEQLLQANQRSLTDYPSMSYPEDVNFPTYLDNSLILAELNYNNQELRSEFEHLFSQMTDEQASIYNQIVEAVNKDEGGIFFLYGYGGTEKTYIWKKLASSLRTDNKIVIMVASSGITSLLLPGAPMAHQFCFVALDHSLRDIIKHNSRDSKIFGGKVMVFGGYFRKILPVIPRGSRSNIVNATINSSYLWDHCQILRLTKNMCLQNNMQATDQEETAAFSQWIIDNGDGEQMEYMSSDLVDKSETIESYHFRSLTTEFLNSLTTSGLPNHCQKLKIGTPIMLLRNLDQTQGLCNDTRLIATRLAKHVIATDIISVTNIGDHVYIPRMSMSPSQSP